MSQRSLPCGCLQPSLNPEAPVVTFPAQFDVPFIEEDQLPFAAAAGSLAFHLLQLTDLAATSLILHNDAHQELAELPLGPAGGISLCPARSQKGRAMNGRPRWYHLPSPDKPDSPHRALEEMPPSNLQTCFSNQLHPKYFLNLLLDSLRYY